METEARQIDSAKVIGEAFRTYGDNFAPLVGGAVVVLGIAGIISGVLSSTESVALSLVGTVISLVAQVLYTGFVVRLVQDVRDGRRDHSVGELFSAAAPSIGALLIMSILFGIAVMIGFVLLIVPGLILITIWAVTAPAIVVEGKGPIESFGRSRELVRGNGWPVFGAILIAFLIVVAALIVATIIGAALGDAGLIVLSAIASVLAIPVSALVSCILFFDLGGGRDAGPGVPMGAATM